jgi:hypothetical protein
MRNVLLSLGAVGFLVVGLPVPDVGREPGPAASSLPPWVSLPAGAELSGIAYTGSGISIALGGYAGDIVPAMKTRLALYGFEISDSTKGYDRFFNAETLFTAQNPSDGRSLKAIAFDLPEGRVLHVTFRDPAPEMATTAN